MNPRLTEIYRSCRSREGLASQDEYKSANVLLGTEVEKFAELIVRECAKVCSEQRNPANLNYKPSEQFAEAVKQHFGVY